jgi:putative peptidoglycan lipid II flippase
MTQPADPVEPTDPVEATVSMAPVTAEGAEQRQSGVLRNSAVMAVATVGSRLSGFVRSLVLVWALGTAIFADSFNLANTIPTSIYILVAGGALNSVFMPQLVRAMKRDHDGGEAFAQRLITLVAIVLATMTVVAVIAAPWLVRLWANPSMLGPQSRPYFDLAVMLARYCLPQIFFYGLYVILGQILNSRGRFGPMMWAPLLNNVVSIAVLLTYIGIGHHLTAQTITGVDKAVLGIGSTVGIAVQALCLLPLLKKVGFRFRFRSDLRGQGLSTSSRLALWTIGFVVINQVWFVIASRITTGVSAHMRHDGRPGGFGLTPYLTAYTIFQLPHSVITVSLVTALLPTLSRLAADADLKGVREDLSNTLRTATSVLAPAAAVFVVLGPLFTQAIFSSGSVPPDAARYIGLILAAFGPGLIGFSSHYISLRAYYAQEDTRTPLFVQFAVIGVGIACALIANSVLAVEHRTIGVAAAYGIGYWVGFLVNLAVLSRRLGGVDGRRIASTYVRVGVAAALAGLIGWLVAHVLTNALPPGRLAVFAAAVIAAAVLAGAYLLFAKLARVRELDQMVGLLTRRLRRG